MKKDTVYTVYVRGYANIPQRFWDTALDTKETHTKYYAERGFHISHTLTGLFKNLSEEERDKVRFDYINGYGINY
jgi:hypothetical protein